MKSYTDIEQSKKLAEILPLESADMRYGYIAPYEFSDRMYEGGYDDVPYPKDFMKMNPNFSEDEYDGEFPCWSLAALIDILPCDWWGYNKHYFLEISKMEDMSAPYYVSYFRFREQSDGANFGRIVHISFQSDNLIDACYEMIIKLHELNLL